MSDSDHDNSMEGSATKPVSVADIEGPWNDPNWDSGLIERCKQYWNVPMNQLPDLIVATYLTQRIATKMMIEEAQRRLLSGVPDGSEWYDGQLAAALQQAIKATQ